MEYWNDGLTIYRIHKSVAPLFHHSIIPLILCVFVTLSLSSCASSNGKRTVVTFWAMGAEGELVAPLIKEFESQNPNIYIDLQFIPWGSAHDKLLTAYAGNATPDMCQLGNTWIPELAAMNAIENLDTLIAKSRIINPENYFSGNWQTNVIGDHVYGVPWYVETRALFYRKDLLDDVGVHHPPKNWNELLEDAKLLTAYSTKKNGTASYGIYLPVNPTFEWQEVFFAWQNGGHLLKDNDCYSNVLSEDVRGGFNFYVKFFKLGYAPKTINETTNLFQSFADGYVCMFINGPWNMNELRNREPQLIGKWAVSPLSMNKNREANAGGSSLVIFRNSKVKKAAWRLIEFLSEPNIQLRFYKRTFDLPAVKSAWQDSTLLGDPNVAAFYTQLESARPFPRIPEWEQIADKMGQWIETAVWGRDTMEQALKGMDQDLNKVLEKRRWLVSKGKF